MKKEQHPSDIEKKVWAKLTLPKGVAKEEVWEQLQVAMQVHATPTKKRRLRPLLIGLLAASVLAGLLVLGLRLTTTTIHCPIGTQQVASLPDGSQVYLNAGSTIEYSSYGWQNNRNVTLQGEAFFEVQKGSRFVVQSSQGQTEVVGTSFNIYARDSQYIVACQTGKVLVTSVFHDSIYLRPTEKVTWVQGHWQKQQQQDIAWRQGSFEFQGTPLQEVVAELERQYAVEISCSPKLNKPYYYTGYFKKTPEVTAALDVLTVSLGLQYKQTAATHYQIQP